MKGTLQSCQILELWSNAPCNWQPDPCPHCQRSKFTITNESKQ